MKTLITALVLCGCSGEAFTSVDFTRTIGDAQEVDGGVTVDSDGGSTTPITEDSGPLGTGGSPSLEKDGGVRHPSTGGALGAGGSVGPGGAASGGASSGGTIGSGGTVGTGGTLGSGGTTCVSVTHDNGLGQTWQDCVPLGTLNLSQAMKACAASGAVQCFARAACGVSTDTVRGYDTVRIVGEWGYDSLGVGYTAPGDGHGNLLGAVCLGADDANNRTWN